MNIVDIDIDKLQPHPDNIKIYGAEDVTELAKDIEQSGWVKELVVTDFYGQYTIVSGHRRHKAAQQLGLDVLPCFVQSFTAEWEVLDRLLRENRTREKTEVQRIMEFKKWKEVEAAKAKERQKELNGKSQLPENFPEAKGEARDFAAEQVGIGSGRNAEKGEKVVDLAMELREKGLDKKADLLLDIINNDSYNGAATIAKEIERLDDDATEEIRRQVTEKNMKAVAALREVKKTQKARAFQGRNDYALYDALDCIFWGSCIDYIPTMQDGSIDCVITDPPYGVDFQMNKYDNELSRKIENDRDISWAIALLDECLEKLKPKMKDDAHLYVFCSWKVLRFFSEIVERHFPIKNLIVWDKKLMGMGDLRYNYADQYELIIFAGGNREFISRPSNLIECRFNDERFHNTQKPTELLRKLIENSTSVGELVFDPFLGSGSTAVAAKQTGRSFKGCEIDTQNYNITISRLENE